MAISLSKIPDEYSFCRKDVWIEVSSDQTAQSNFSFKILVEYYDGDSWIAFPYLYYYADENGKAVFNIKHLLLRKLKDNLPLPWHSIEQTAGVPEFLQYRVTAVEFYGDTPTDQASVTSDSLYAINGFVNSSIKEDETFNGYFSYYGNNVHLTKKMPFWMFAFFLSSSGSVSYTVKVKMYLNTNQTKELSVKEFTDPVTKVFVPCGVKQIIPNEYWDSVKKYDVWIESNGTPVYDTVSFYVREQTLEEVYIIYRNRFGVPESMPVSSVENNFKVEKTIKQRTYNMDVDFSELFDNFEESFVLNLSLMDNKKAELVKDILLSDYTYLWFRNEYKKIAIEKQSVKLTKFNAKNKISIKAKFNDNESINYFNSRGDFVATDFNPSEINV